MNSIQNSRSSSSFSSSKPAAYKTYASAFRRQFLESHRVLIGVVLFGLATACTVPAKKETPKEAPQKSPYTVGDCACMKIYMPVCGSDGRTYGNSCEAECNKMTWKDGGCKK